MSVVIETTLGDITVDLYLEQRPVTCLNFLKLCKMKFYNFNLFHSIRSGFIAQTGDPTGEGSGGQSIFGVLEGPEKRFFSGEKMPKIRHTDAGLISMVCTGDMMVGSQFYFTLAPDLDSLDGVHCVIGEVSEGHEVLRKLNDVICDESHRPYRDVRITHTVVLEDPFNDPPGFRAPSRSPSPSAERLKGGRIAPDEEIDETQGKSAAEVQEIIEEKEAKARATILEIIGDLPDAEIAPPENVLFVCKLNPVTTDDDLEIIFSRFGKIVTCEVIRDKKTGDSLQYAFIEFADKKSCEDAYFKMDNVLIDDRRIHVDFSQSVSKIKWLGKGRGVKHLNDDEINDSHTDHIRKRHSRSRDIEYKNGRDYDSNRDNYNDKRRHEDMDKHRDKERHHDRSRNNKEHSNRSHSKTDSSRDVYRNDRNHTHNSRYSEKDNSDKKHISYKHNNNMDRKEYHIMKDTHSMAGKSESTSRKTKEKSEHIHKRDNKDKYERKDTKYPRSVKDIENNKLKRKHHEADTYKETKKSKAEKVLEARTPSPAEEQELKNQKSTKQKERRRKIKKSKSIKRKRKPSTSSSESASSESSSSSESTSSSDKDRKKSLKKRKKKCRSSSSSSSSSSSDSSSSSSSSSDSSSSSTSSSESESKKRKKPKRTRNKKVVRKPKNKL